VYGGWLRAPAAVRHVMSNNDVGHVLDRDAWRGFCCALSALLSHCRRRPRPLLTYSFISRSRLILVVTAGRNCRRRILSTLRRQSSVSHPASSPPLLVQLLQLAMPEGVSILGDTDVRLPPPACACPPAFLLCGRFFALRRCHPASVITYINSQLSP